MRPFASLRFLLACAALATASANAQSYSIDWFTIAGGGGASTGGVYAVTGTIGQPAAGLLSGGTYTLQGGFWGILGVVQTPATPYLNVLQTNGLVTIYWSRPATGFVLERTPTLSGTTLPWVPAGLTYQTNDTHIFVTTPPLSGNHFFRLRQ